MKRCCVYLVLSISLMVSVSEATDEIWPVPVRAAHFVLAPSSPEARTVPLQDALRVLGMVCSAGYNTLVVQVANGIRLDAAPELSRDGSWTKKDVAIFLESARNCGIDVIPELKLLTHQEKFFQSHFPDLMYNAVTYDPRDERVYSIVFDVLDEIISIMKPRAISIGHDEVVGWNKEHARRKLAPGESMLPADLYLADVLTVHEYIKKQNIDTWMWGDMLFAPDEVPQFHPSDLHGSPTGYGKSLRDKIPKDIVICDWHYSAEQTVFPTMSILQAEGFRVIGAVWKKGSTARNFSAYAAEHGAYGMMATTWFYVPLRQWPVVDSILSESGRAIGAAFGSE